MKKLAICLFLLLLIGCGKTEGDIKTGKLRHSLFVECMGLAAKIPRQADDDVSDIVGECSLQAYYIANQMSK